MANYITGIRILCSIALLFCREFSPAFYTLYITAGISDMADGITARRTNTVSEFGSALDSAADLLFVLVCSIKLLPLLEIPAWICLWITLIALIKAVNIFLSFMLQKKFAAIHSNMNKITGALLFLFPLTLQFIDLKYSAAVVCTVATIAAAEETFLILKMKRP